MIFHHICKRIADVTPKYQVHALKTLQILNEIGRFSTKIGQSTIENIFDFRDGPNQLAFCVK